ncbi:MAG: hypothetical protein SWZ49_07830 [Cyanobacteriota bacterium]|nr:hypothetical protein [Cyanobacteriota bacterium]
MKYSSTYYPLPNPQFAIRNSQFAIPDLKFPFDKLEIESKVGKRQIAVDP